MIRTVGNVVHIGTNSVTLEDASTTSSGKDEIASSGNDLQIGTSTSHSTTVKGTLSVQTPTSDNHATTKAYVDDLTTTNTSNISSNTNSINSNTSNISNNTDSIQTNLGLININIDKIKDIETGLTQSFAMAALSEPRNGKSNFSIATGNYNGTSAVAYGLSHRDSKNNIMYRLIGSKSSNVSSSAFSMGWTF